MDGGQNNYDFILNDKSKPASRLPLPNLSRPIWLIGALVGLTLIIAIFGTVLGSSKSKVGGLTEVIGLGQEINRVSADQLANLSDPNLTALTATTQNTLSSDQAQLKKYAADHKIKINTKKLASYQNQSTDDSLAKAASNNYLDSAFRTYLRDALTDYQSALSSAYDGTTDGGVRVILRASYQSVKVLLVSQVLAGN